MIFSIAAICRLPIFLTGAGCPGCIVVIRLTLTALCPYRDMGPDSPSCTKRLTDEGLF